MIPVSVGEVKGKTMLLGEIFLAVLALEAAAAKLMDSENVLVQRLLVGVHSRAQVAAILFSFHILVTGLLADIMSQHHSSARMTRPSVSLDVSGEVIRSRERQAARFANVWLHLLVNGSDVCFKMGLG